MFRKLFLSLLIVTFATSAYSENAVYLDSVVGIDPDNPNGIIAGVPLEFVFNFRVEYDESGLTNAVRFYSPDGATWQPISRTLNPVMDQFFDLTFWGDRYHNVTGSGADTIGFGGASLGSKLPAGYDDWAWKDHTMVLADDIGKTFCVDSTWMPPGWVWLWADNGPPAWYGPYCFEIVDCCTGIRGDFNYDGELDITDLTDFVSWFHGNGPAAFCTLEINTDGLWQGGQPSTIVDYVYYINYMFRNGPPPIDCP